MIGFIVLFTACIVFMVSLYFLMKKINDCDFDTFAWVMIFLVGVTAIVFLCLILFRPLGVNRDIADFEEYKIYAEEVYTFEESSLCDFNDNYDTLDKCVSDLTIYKTVLNYNMWLTASRAKEESYGIFTFYDERVWELEYIVTE